ALVRPRYVVDPWQGAGGELHELVAGSVVHEQPASRRPEPHRFGRLTRDGVDVPDRQRRPPIARASPDIVGSIFGRAGIPERERFRSAPEPELAVIVEAERARRETGRGSVEVPGIVSLIEGRAAVVESREGSIVASEPLVPSGVDQ